MQALVRLQARAGNGAVARLLAPDAATRGRTTAAPAGPVASGNVGMQRLVEAGGACPPPPVAPTPADPRADSRFAAVEGQVHGAAAAAKKHPSGAAEADQARRAAEPPSDDKAGQAKAAQADRMAAAKPKGFDKAGFMAAVKAAIAKAAPQNLDEADKFATSGKADAVKGEVMGKVAEGKKSSAADIEATTAQPPDPSVAKDKPVTPLPPQPAPQVPAVDGAKAMPGKAPTEQTDLRGGPCSVNKDMAVANVSDQDLAASNEPQMQQALAAKKTAEAHAAQAPAQIRQKEGEALQEAQAGASADAKTAVAALTGVKGQAGGQVGTQKSAAKAREETERKRISGDINKIYDRVKGEVTAILTGLDAKVSGEFEAGEKEARAAFTAQHKAEMEKYKDQRYSGPAGWLRWTGDLFMSVPKEANDIFVRAKALYEERLTAVISKVADLIGQQLDEAKKKIAAGREEIRVYVAKQPKDLQKIAQATATEVSGKFDQLESDVDDKSTSLVDDLAQKYVEARNAVDEEIKAEQAKNAGLVDMAKNAIGESVKAILQLKDLFFGLLSKAASAFDAIVAAPVRFITNFMSAVKQGFLKFADNILAHLKKGLQGWLFGQLANAGIELPEKLDLMGVLKMIASLMGLTWAHLKSRIIAKVPPLGKVWDAVESKIDIAKKFATEGITGIWNWIKEKVGDVKQMIFDQIKSFVIERVVKAGITWVLGMLNPAGALIKIVQALISVVQWIMERGKEMGEFIGTIIDAVMDIARGGLGGVPEKIENSLSRAVPLVISFLAGLLGLGGISEKVKEFFAKGQELVGKGIDWVLGKVINLARPLIRLAMKGVGYVKKKYEAGKAYVKGKYEAGKAYVKKKWEGVKGYVKGKVEAGRTWVAGKVQAGKEALFRLLRKPFSVEGVSHTLTVNRAGKILIASNSGLTMDAHARGAQEAARASGRTDMLPSIEELNALRLRHEAHFAAVRDQEVANLDPSDPKNRPFLAAIDTIVAMARQIWTVIHYSGRPGEANVVTPDGLGNIAPHARQITPRPNLESEHVLPRKWLSNIFEHAAGLRPLSDRQYAQMTTILIWKGAADLKTEGDEGDNTGLRRLLTGEEGIGNAGPSVVTRVDLTMRAINADHQANHRPGEPMPTRAAVSQAAALQVGEVVRFARENADVAMSRGADFEGSQNLISLAASLISAGDSDPKFATKVSNLAGRFSRWLTDHSGTAPASTRAQMSAVHARLLQERDRRQVR
ncbi:phage tail protein [Geodermatophilus ruber]|uniref:phage tail protein n=1 Tax=Geodermatophilus ruber TaxID=504800 RepID=UPI001160BFE2|nr:hypothetical protein [Geodermatophilus ruber]